MTIPNKIKWLTIAHQMILLLLVEKETHLVRLKPVKPKTLHVFLADHPADVMEKPIKIRNYPTLQV
jgi:hypothetical protein